MTPTTVDLSKYRSTGDIEEAVVLAVHDTLKTGDPNLAAEIRRMDQIIQTYELRIDDWSRVQRQMNTVTGYEFLADAIEKDKFMLAHARFYRTALERSAKESAR